MKDLTIWLFSEKWDMSDLVHYGGSTAEECLEEAQKIYTGTKICKFYIQEHKISNIRVDYVDNLYACIKPKGESIPVFPHLQLKGDYNG